MAIKKAAKVKRKEIDVADIKTLLNQPIKYKSKKFKFTEKQKDLLREFETLTDAGGAKHSPQSKSWMDKVKDFLSSR